MSSSSNNPADDKVAAAHKALFDEGIKLRTQVNGAEYVEKSLKNGSEFARPMQELVTEACWGSVWARPGLEKKWRSLINVAMLVALNRSTELATHVKGALTNGATEAEIREVLLQAAIYCGMPAGLEGFRVAQRVIEAAKEEGNGK
ncbi:putative 4-carboxymuconolactone decarboxylase [Diaporthe ampelina]|uniref:Putative 4-carboxymuconolactone decarboxylase n=1 Tax=Diaporthe ampelina TaxID=1214573 RepID=A0A0G2FAP5_9PEZI|nr:putative 4-carboxymuconolactone decarboxylase [Diaporthe ampelina]